MKYEFSFEKIREKLARKKAAYYVCIRIEQSLRKQSNPTMKQTLHTTENYNLVFYAQKPDSFVSQG
ncbi:MAG: hypothetical protein JST17_07615 [Bacteroidetes bacterium]|nr:hypothetical protein [Bacteroidota bacterium]MBS1931613.1 hypothetical protein [Bacteroidota bacterium]